MSSVHVPEQVAPMMPRTLFNSDHEAFRKTARRFFEQEIALRAVIKNVGLQEEHTARSC